MPRNPKKPARKLPSSIPLPPLPSKPPVFPKDSNGVRYWLIKTEPLSRIDPRSGNDVKFSLEDLSKVDREPWTGVRNYEAKNNMLNMAKDDVCLVYHSNCPNPGIVGVSRIASDHCKPDPLQYDRKSGYFDAKSTKETPRWWCPDVSFACRLRRKVSLAELKDNPDFKEMSLVKRGRLSVSPVRESEFKAILKIQEEGDGEEGEVEFDCNVKGMRIHD
ncbi:DEKNAAC103919 [Brettanomyces naardenensis]|uniref:DEKNAAC103919 n=1 Tax=Brettanomyces naardenensis TaxID=13370 RepID=A0A448YPK4_BRENA|nr:DEKNAAC103919 [Brettanomyces naardenensis]